MEEQAPVAASENLFENDKPLKMSDFMTAADQVEVSEALAELTSDNNRVIKAFTIITSKTSDYIKAMADRMNQHTQQVAKIREANLDLEMQIEILKSNNKQLEQKCNRYETAHLMNAMKD